MDDINHSNQIDEAVLDELIEQQVKMEEEWQAKQVITPIRFNCSVKQCVIPAIQGYTEKTITLSENASADQRLIFSALYTAYYLYFYTDEYTVSRKATYSQVIPRFISFLHEYQFKKENRITILKNYETYRVTVNKVKTTSSGLRLILQSIRAAIDYEEFRNQLNDIDYSYLYTLTKTKVAPDDDQTQITMTEWFGHYTWLRRDKVGIGHNLYARLASPKALISSFRITIVTAFLEIQSAKHSLISFFKKTKWTLDDIPIIKNRSEFDTNTKWCNYRNQHAAEIMNRLRRAYNEYGGNEKHLKLAIKIIVSETVLEHSQDIILQKIQSNLEIRYRNKRKSSFVTGHTESMFSFPFLRTLLSYALSLPSESKPVPISNTEYILFGWLMAYQTVQPSDISKLSSKDFQFIRRRNGKTTHIDLKYFKGRAGKIHSVKMLKTNTDLGKAVLNFLQDKGDFSMDKNSLRISSSLSISNGSPVTKFMLFCQKFLREKIDENLAIENASSVFLDAMASLIEKGVIYNKNKYKTPEYYRVNVDTPLKKTIFSLTAIKNSSIHSRSDTFTPTQLLNYHSHTNKVERKSYLSEQNEEWLNNCGRVTRAVMQDLTVNLFRTSKNEKQIFNSEFIKFSKIIDAKRDDILSRMKLITGKNNGRVDELGLTHLDNQTEHLEPHDTIYLVDSKETVMKLKYYQAEVRKKHHLLIDNAPEFLLFTVLPTVEWIEVLFEQKKFCKKTLSQGNALYKRYKDILPPLFTPQIGS